MTTVERAFDLARSGRHRSLGKFDEHWPMKVMSAYTRAALAEITRQLPPGWQATALSALLILYKEVREYPDAAILERSG